MYLNTLLVVFKWFHNLYDKTKCEQAHMEYTRMCAPIQERIGTSGVKVSFPEWRHTCWRGLLWMCIMTIEACSLVWLGSAEKERDL